MTNYTLGALPLNEEQAEELLERYVANPSQLMHARAVRAVMRYFATKYEEDIDYWSQVGLLHDIDYELHPEEHLEHTDAILRGAGYDDDFINAILSHGWGLCKVDVEPVHKMEKVLYAADELTGLITASVYMRPDRSVLNIETKSIKKKFKNKKFAAGVDREVILQGTKMLEIELDELIGEVILAMRTAADELGLEGEPA
ncbi:MAG: HDIG domain-containing protein [Coriobacteriia bacterium]|nr:HDIG domain-containing protein [Coriobacteriia bacterium]MCL2870728.1 HDIG domain-containing protein [Coriobacteriia bacterium]